MLLSASASPEPLNNALYRVLRKVAERTREGLWHLIGQTLDHFQSQECRNFCENAGDAT